MVLEHLEAPQPFWSKLHRILRPWGVFLGFTVDRRHWFPPISRALEYTGLKDRFLKWSHGSVVDGRYRNYRTYYRSNTPDAIHRLAAPFSAVHCESWYYREQLLPYFPRGLSWLAPAVAGVPPIGGRGLLLVIRAQK
jgi:hypothetical protein